MTDEYVKREIVPEIDRALQNMPVVVLTGLRQSGKSTILSIDPHFKKRRYITFDDFATLEAAKHAPENLISGSEPISIDEAQKVPEILDVIKCEVDKKREAGRFLLSGSVNFHLLRSVSESLAGRAIYLQLHPFTRREVHNRADASPFLPQFFKSRSVKNSVAYKPIKTEEIAIGGMPPVCLKETKDPDIWFRGYEQAYLERDIRNLSQVADLMTFRHLLHLAALRSGGILNQSELGRDAKLNSVTTGRYISLMETSYVLHRLPPYLRNRASRLIKSPKLYVGDSGLACHLADIDNIARAPNMIGPMLETYLAQQLKAIISSHWPKAQLFFWQVQGRYEVDFIIEVGNEAMAIEVKWASRWSERDLAGLKAFQEQTPHCKMAVLAYNGTKAVKLGKKLWAIPLGLLIS